MNLTLLKEKVKRDILIAISNYEKKYNIPLFVTSAVISEILCELKSAEMQEMLGGEYLDERNNGENGKNKNGFGENADRIQKTGESN